MSQIAFPAVFMRGGTSKGLFFHRRDLPAERAEWDALFLAALGSPDPHGRQLDGMGGGISSLSKFVLIFVDVSGRSSMGCQLSLAPSQPLGAGFGRHRAAR